MKAQLRKLEKERIIEQGKEGFEIIVTYETQKEHDKLHTDGLIYEMDAYHIHAGEDSKYGGIGIIFLPTKRTPKSKITKVVKT